MTFQPLDTDTYFHMRCKQHDCELEIGDGPPFFVEAGLGVFQIDLSDVYCPKEEYDGEAECSDNWEILMEVKRA